MRGEGRLHGRLRRATGAWSGSGTPRRGQYFSIDEKSPIQSHRRCYAKNVDNFIFFPTGRMVGTYVGDVQGTYRHGDAATGSWR